MICNKKKTSGKRGLSRAEKAAMTIIIIITVWILSLLTQAALPIQSMSHPPYSASISSHAHNFRLSIIGYNDFATSSYSILTSSASSARDFTLPIIGPDGLTGQSISLSVYRGKVILLEFMQPGCPHCQIMASVLEKLYKQHAADVVFVSVVVGASVDDTAKFIRDSGWVLPLARPSWVYLYDTSGSTLDLYGVSVAPTFFVIGRDSSIVTSLQGEQSYDTLQNVLAQASKANQVYIAFETHYRSQ